MGTVGFIGLGQMGGPMARRIADAGGSLVVFDTRPEALAPLTEAGAEAAASPRGVAAAADLISLMVRDDDQVRAVVGGDDGVLAGARPGTVVAIHSTIRAETAELLQQEAAPHGVDVVDAPVSGGFLGARSGRLAVMVGGSPEAFDRCLEPFGAWADLVLHVGGVGAGTRTKLARNLLHFVAFTAAGEAQRLAEASGVELRMLAEIVRHSDTVTGGAGAIMLRDTTAPPAPEDGWHSVLSNVRGLGEKDLSLALELGEQLGIDLPLGQLARDRLAEELGVPHPPDDEPGDGGAPASKRQRGLDMMRQVYGFDLKDRPGDFFALTVDHLFADVWTRPGLSLRDRRLLLLGMLAAQGGLEDIGEIQVRAALRNGELGPDELREIGIFLTHYVGWPLGTKLSMLVERLLAEQRASDGRA
jgi:3-hydroxyisobutyrate dehydrogenase-like beta-hydroxyacid dehydrogenase/alkylhydroperoxidase/carboxymuconolactone decarboxylase family protein YurZ